MTPKDHYALPTDMLLEWQSIVDLIVKLSGVRACLVMKMVVDNIAVLISSNTENNPYRVGDQEHLKDSGLYCEAVIATGQPLLIPNALKDPKWDKNPDLKFGFLSYLGLPIRLPDGNTLGTLCVLDDKENHYSQDIIELMGKMRDLIEGQIRLREENRQHRLFAKESVLRRILDSVPVAIACASIDGGEYRTFYLNQTFSRISGVGPAESNAFGYWPKLTINNNGQEFIHEISLSDVLAHILRDPESRFCEEMRLLDANGAWLDVVFTAVLIEDLLLVTLVDITERKANEEKLIERQARLKLVLAASGLGTWDWDCSQDVAVFDARSLAIVGCDVADKLKNIDEWQAGIHPDDLPLVRSRLKDHIDGHTPVHEAEYRKRHPEGHWVWVRARGKIVARDPNGWPLRMTGTLQDISQHKQLESESASLLQQISLLIQNTVKSPREGIDFPEAEAEKRLDKLTRRQKEILQLVASGLTSAEIADQLNISVETVDTHRRDLMRKLNIRSVAGLTKIAIQEGLLS